MSAHTNKIPQASKEAFFEKLVAEARVCEVGGIERLLKRIRAVTQNFRVLWFENGVWVRSDSISIASEDADRWDDVLEFLRLLGLSATLDPDKEFPKCKGTYNNQAFLVFHVKDPEEPPPQGILPLHAIRYSGW